MRTTRLELDARQGHVAIQRQRGSDTIRIDSILRDPFPGQQAWETWKIPAGSNADELFMTASVIFFRLHGHDGCHDDVLAIVRRLQEFQD